MKRRITARVLIGATLLVVGVAGCAGGRHDDHTRQGASSSATEKPSFAGACFDRTELFFGTAKPDGMVVSDMEFQAFVDREVTRRFPEGVTLLSGYGQFRGANGRIVQEAAKLLIVLYPAETQGDSSAKIEQIRSAYKAAFHQESVLRADRQCERVGF